jgi:type IV secretion system protein VirB4
MHCYLDAGIPVVRETLGLEVTFWAQIPGNMKYIARSSLITSENFSDFCPLHNCSIGYKNNNHLGSAVTLLSTSLNTPYFFNFHLQGCKDSPSPGHTIILGSNGSGKTVLITFLDAQLSRYEGISIFFDRNRGAEIYIRACNGYYAILSPDRPDETCFNPFLLKDTPTQRRFCQSWLEQLCKSSVDSVIGSHASHALKNCVDYAYDHLSDEHRHLSQIVKILPVDFSYWLELSRWLKASDGQGNGEFSYLFDNTRDILQCHRKIGFDMTHFLDNEPLAVRTALLMYLFHWIKQQLTGQLVAIYLDEAWQYLTDPYWQKELKRLLPTLRKLNAFLVLATQSSASICESPLSAMILDNCATQIYFPNPQAKDCHYIDNFNLSDAEYVFIKNNTPHCRKFLIKQGQGSSVCKLDLSHSPEVISVLSANEKNIRLLDLLRKKYNDVDMWLKEYFKAVGVE